jgi:Major Facilitator Superfamily
MATWAASETFYGWRIVAAAFVLAVFGWGLGFYGPPIFLQAVRDLRGWSLPLVSAAVTAHFLFGALVVARLPKLYLRYGLPAVTKASVLSLSVGICGWAIAAEPWQLFVAAFFSGAGWVAMGAAAINAIIAPWFIRTRPAALAMAYNGASIGGVLFSPLWVAAIGQWGFVTAAAIVGVLVSIAVFVLTDVYFAKTPQQMGLSPDGDGVAVQAASSASATVRPLADASLWTDRRFVTLAAGTALSLFAQIGLLAHLFSLLVPTVGAPLAGIAISAATAAAIAGRTLVGWLMPVGADRRLVACGNFAVQITGSVAFWMAEGSNIPLLVLGVILFGIGIGNATSLPPLIAQAEFAREDVSRVVALNVAISQGAYAFAPASFGLIREFAPQAGAMAGAAAPYLFVAAALFQFAAVAAFLAGRRRAAGL